MGSFQYLQPHELHYLLEHEHYQRDVWSDQQHARPAYHATRREDHFLGRTNRPLTNARGERAAGIRIFKVQDRSGIGAMMLQYRSETAYPCRIRWSSMTNEEMQRAMDFIVEQQAQSSAKIDALAEAQTRNTEGIGALLSIAEIHEREINTLSHQVSSLSRDIATIGESTRATDGRLNALINVVERQITEGRNGKP